MDYEKTGNFIARLRGEQGLTQKALADRIGVTDKAVSKWENGRGFPDVGVLEILSKELGVSVTELMNGERLDLEKPEKTAAQADSAVLETLRYVKQMGRRTVGVIVIIIGACLCLAPMVMAGAGSSFAILILGILVILGGVFMTSNKTFGISRIAYEFISLGAIIAVIILELLPNGVVLWWAVSTGELNSTFYSYFDPTPFGMAHFSPLITAGLTVVSAVLTTIALIVNNKHHKLRNALFICLTVTAAISVCPVLFGFKYVTPIGVFITAMLVVSTISRAAANAKK
ncbi:MAG: helix-turn-helix transcriptional regulator [Oscillospiraceae bacterium]|nr:helix-turn-helix transcriptional regulator [Oscillospiraceae bacterium]